MWNNQCVYVITDKNFRQIPDKGPHPKKPTNNIQITDKGVNKCIERINERKAWGPNKITILKETA